jgi:uncharacterized protein
MRLPAFFFLLSLNAAFAQSYPSFQNTTVNDYADLLDAADEVALSSRLDDLRRDTGVEMTVLTLDTRSSYAPNQTLEQFATGVFNHWGIGDAKRNDGVLVMILRRDRAMRVELGAGYGREWDRVAQHVVNREFLPAFKNDDYPRGIMNGSAAIIEDVVMPFYAGVTAPARPGKSNLSLWVFGSFAAFIALIFGASIISDLIARFRPCPKCGHRSLRQSRRVVLPPRGAIFGQGMLQVTCSSCDYFKETSYMISSNSRDGGSSGNSSGGFGGGRSGGGGASGRW